jgi:CRP-like cAMP-binding protein
MLYIVSGRFRLVESGIEFPVGAIVGEFGMLSPSNIRTQTLECIEAGLILSVSYTKVEELYVQNPEFGFYFLRLASARLFQNIEKLEQRAGAAEPHAATRLSAGSIRVFSDFRESLRYLFADFIGEQDDTPPFLPDGLPEAVVSVASDAIHLLIDYQGTAYARLHVERLRRFHRQVRRR